WSRCSHRYAWTAPRWSVSSLPSYLASANAGAAGTPTHGQRLASWRWLWPPKPSSRLSSDLVGLDAGLAALVDAPSLGGDVGGLDAFGDLTTPSGRGILALLSGLAEEERHRILKRANEGRVAAIKRGRRLGRTPKLNDHQQKEAIKRLKAGESC